MSVRTVRRAEMSRWRGAYVLVNLAVDIIYVPLFAFSPRNLSALLPEPQDLGPVHPAGANGK